MGKLNSLQYKKFNALKIYFHQSFIKPFVIWFILISRLPLIVVKVLTYQTLHVQSTARKHSLKIHWTQPHWHLSLVRIVHSHVRPIKLWLIVLRIIHHRSWFNPFLLRNLLNYNKNTLPSRYNNPGSFFIIVARYPGFLYKMLPVS